MPSKTQIYIALGVLLFLILLAWYFYKRGKSQITLQSLPGELPGNPGSGNVSGASNDEIKNIAVKLHGDMSGWNFLGHNPQPYSDALLLNDGDLIKLYNTYNTMYQKESGQTLTQWIEAESYTLLSEDNPHALYNRLLKLNAK